MTEDTELDRLQARIQVEVDSYNKLLADEQAAQAKVEEIRSNRIAAFGRAQMIQDLLQEQLNQESIAASKVATTNGHTEGDVVLDSAEPVQYSRDVGDTSAPDGEGD